MALTMPNRLTADDVCAMLESDLSGVYAQVVRNYFQSAYVDPRLPVLFPQTDKEGAAKIMETVNRLFPEKGRA